MDIFDPVNVSRQRRWQIRQLAAGRCERCGRKRGQRGHYCNKCQAKRREMAARSRRCVWPEEWTV